MLKCCFSHIFHKVQAFPDVLNTLASSTKPRAFGMHWSPLGLYQGAPRIIFMQNWTLASSLHALWKCKVVLFVCHSVRQGFNTYIYSCHVLVYWVNYSVNCLCIDFTGNCSLFSLADSLNVIHIRKYKYICVFIYLLVYFISNSISTVHLISSSSLKETNITQQYNYLWFIDYFT